MSRHEVHSTTVYYWDGKNISSHLIHLNPSLSWVQHRISLVKDTLHQCFRLVKDPSPILAIGKPTSPINPIVYHQFSSPRKEKASISKDKQKKCQLVPKMHDFWTKGGQLLSHQVGKRFSTHGYSEAQCQISAPKRLKQSFPLHKFVKNVKFRAASRRQLYKYIDLYLYS